VNQQNAGIKFMVTEKWNLVFPFVGNVLFNEQNNGFLTQITRYCHIQIVSDRFYSSNVFL